MSFGALGANAKEALGRAATAMGTSTTTGDGGMTDEERRASEDAGLSGAAVALRPQPGRSAARRTRSRSWSARAPSPAAAACCSGRRSPSGSRRCATCRSASTSAAPAATRTGPAPTISTIKIQELREITDWEKPIYVKVGATRTRYDVALAVKAGADVVVVDGMQGGTAATQDVFIEHVGIPTFPPCGSAVEALQELDMHRKVQLIVSGGIRSGADVAKALALGADAVSIGTAALVALGCNKGPLRGLPRARHRAGNCHHCHTGRCPVGITTQDPELQARLAGEDGARLVRNFLTVLTLELQTLARACGKSHVHNLEPEDLVALTVEAAAMAQVPLAGTDWIPGRGTY